VDIDWVLDQFGNLGSAELELASTVVFVDQENLVRQVGATEDELDPPRPSNQATLLS